MNLEEYNALIKQAEEDFLLKKKQITRDCALSNNPYKVGDVITDHVGSIKIEKIKYAFGRFGELPCCTYEGVILNKNGEPSTKKDNKRGVWQNNIITTQE